MNLFTRATILGAIFFSGAATTTTSPAFAQRAFRADLVGDWTTDSNEFYVLRSNGTYTFKTGIADSGNVSHSGTWTLRNSGHTLRLHATRRVVLEGNKRRTLKANRIFSLRVENLDPETITLDKEEFYRPREGRAPED